MSSTILIISMAVSAFLAVALLCTLVLVADLYRKLNRIISDTSGLQRMVTVHADSQLTEDGHFKSIQNKLEVLLQRDLQVQSLAAAYSSVENAETLVDSVGVTDAERLAIQSGLTEREANLMLQLRTAYSSENVSRPDRAK